VSHASVPSGVQIASLNNVDNYENINLNQTIPTAMRYDSTILPKIHQKGTTYKCIKR
jgi:hypothetical protein